MGGRDGTGELRPGRMVIKQKDGGGDQNQMQQTQASQHAELHTRGNIRPVYKFLEKINMKP